MAKKPANTFNRKKTGGSRYAALAVFTVIFLVVIGYWFTKQPVKPDILYPAANETKSKPAVKIPSTDDVKLPPPVVPKKALETQKPSVREPYPEDSSPAYKEQNLPQKADTKSGKLSIIIDDMGTTLQEARALFSIGVPLTFSIIPGLRSYKEVAAFSEKNGVETMIHIPMQSKGWPERRLEANGLLISMDETEIQKRVNDLILELPHAIGSNNHMGSEFTEHEDKMRPVLLTLKKNGLFFVDSVTSPKTVGQHVAKDLGIKYARRTVFLDNEQSEVYIRGQLQQAVKLAKKQGSVIAICHPHPVTVSTLAKVLPTLKQQGITLVFASNLVHM